MKEKAGKRKLKCCIIAYTTEGHHINVHFKCYYRTIPQAWVNCSCSLIFFTIIYVCIQWMFYYINMSLASFINPKKRDYNDWYISVFDSHIYNNNAMWVINGLSYFPHASNILFMACRTSILADTRYLYFREKQNHLLKRYWSLVLLLW